MMNEIQKTKNFSGLGKKIYISAYYLPHCGWLPWCSGGSEYSKDLKDSKIHRKKANEVPTSCFLSSYMYISSVLMYWLIFGFNADFGFTAVYAFTVINLRLQSHLL